MKPGVATSPLASIRCFAAACWRSPIAAMWSPTIPISPINQAAPVPSTMRGPCDQKIVAGLLCVADHTGEQRPNEGNERSQLISCHEDLSRRSGVVELYRRPNRNAFVDITPSCSDSRIRVLPSVDPQHSPARTMEIRRCLRCGNQAGLAEIFLKAAVLVRYGNSCGTSLPSSPLATQHQAECSYCLPPGRRDCTEVDPIACLLAELREPDHVLISQVVGQPGQIDSFYPYYEPSHEFSHLRGPKRS